MARTQIDLVTAVMEELGVLAAGQSVSAEDRDVIIRRLDPKVAELNERLIAYIQDTDDIDDAYFLPLVKIMAAECAVTFGCTGQKKSELDANAFRAEQTLRDVVRPKGTRQMLATEPGMWVRRYGYWRM